MDGAFFRQDMLRWLQGRGVGYAIKVPFYRWLDLQRYIRDSPTWVPVAPGVTGFAVPGAETPWHIPVTVTIYRKKVDHRATKNYQLDLFDPNDGHYEYSAVTSNLALTVRNVWYFACGRGNHEKTIAQLKTGLAFHSVPTQTYAANSAWQQLVVLAHNLLTNFQLETGAPPRRRTRKHTVVPLLQSVQTLRFELCVARVVQPVGVGNARHRGRQRLVHLRRPAHDPAMAPRDVVTCGPDGVPCATSRTDSIAVVGKAWVEQRAQDLHDGLGHEPVKDRRDTEHPRPTAGLGPSHLAHRRWNVGRVQPLLSDGVPLRTEIGREVFDTHAVDTRCPLVALVHNSIEG